MFLNRLLHGVSLDRALKRVLAREAKGISIIFGLGADASVMESLTFKQTEKCLAELDWSTVYAMRGKCIRVVKGQNRRCYMMMTIRVRENQQLKVTLSVVQITSWWRFILDRRRLSYGLCTPSKLSSPLRYFSNYSVSRFYQYVCQRGWSLVAKLVTYVVVVTTFIGIWNLERTDMLYSSDLLQSVNLSIISAAVLFSVLMRPRLAARIRNNPQVIKPVRTIWFTQIGIIFMVYLWLIPTCNLGLLTVHALTAKSSVHIYTLIERNYDYSVKGCVDGGIRIKTTFGESQTHLLCGFFESEVRWRKLKPGQKLLLLGSESSIGFKVKEVLNIQWKE